MASTVSLVSQIVFLRLSSLLVTSGLVSRNVNLFMSKMARLFVLYWE